MYAKVCGETIAGLNGAIIVVEVDLDKGLPSFDIVGLPDLAVKESRERVKTALKNSGFPFPKNRITVNLAPANLKKDGSGLDLPIAIGILISSGLLPQEKVREKIFIGELSLEGVIRPVNGVLPMIIEARDQGFAEIFIPPGNGDEGNIIEEITVYTPPDLRTLVAHLNYGQLPSLPKGLRLIEEQEGPEVDFADVRGQLVAKRALEIAAAGGHNLLLEGSPGSGKTMLARRLPSILPPLTEEEALQVTKIYSVAGLLREKGKIMGQRPFRSPHHTISFSALAGGGAIPKPGEVTLSHNGVLFLDEFPEFTKSALEVLRQPLEDGCITISRVQASYTYPANFVLITACNPCPCGFFGDEDKMHKCTCQPADIERYKNKISGPLLDRIDLQVHVPRVEYKDLRNKQKGENSATIRARVCQARHIQLQRFANSNIFSNAQMSHRQVEAYCQLSEQSASILEIAFNTLGLSARSYDRILKVARTIADLAGSPHIKEEHLSEAIQLRTHNTR